MPSIATVIGVLSASVGHALDLMAQGGQGHTDELFRTHIGGSAVLEGVMMRGRNGWAVSVREESGGIYVEERPPSRAGGAPGLAKADDRTRLRVVCRIDAHLLSGALHCC